MSKKKKEKVIYYDDGMTISDMSRVNKKGEKQSPPPPRRQSTSAEKWRTYWTAVKQMLFPMAVVLCIIGILYAIMMLIANNVQ